MSLGAMNAYFAGGARLGAALGRDGALPVWFARGSSAGTVPRRSLAVVTGCSLGVLLVLAVTGQPVESTVLLTTGAFTLVYVVGTAAAVRLLPRSTWVWRGAVLSFAGTVGLLVMTGTHLVAAGLIALGALGWTFRREARPADADPA
jgi:amino acid efflux transporter